MLVYKVFGLDKLIMKCLYMLCIGEKTICCLSCLKAEQKSFDLKISNFIIIKQNL